MAETETQKTGKQRAGDKRKAGGAKQRAGRIQVRRETAEYRAAAQEQAARVREEIDVALAHARRMREEIEARIETNWQNRFAPKPAETKAGGRRRRAKS
jgi:hypothetical protein